MRLGRTIPSVVLSLLVTFVDAEPAAEKGSLDPPALQPLINRANTLLSAGQFNEAARTYTEALEQSPMSYLLYFKRATAHLSLSRHEPALADFDKVLELTGGTFDKALLSKGKIFAKEARWTEARDMMKTYSRKHAGDREAGDLLFGVSEGEVTSKKAYQAQRAKHWGVCIEESSKALQTATHSASLRQLRADCALAQGDIEQTVGDLTRLTHLTAASTPLLLRISSLAYYLLPQSSQALSTLKQCLHYDPDSKPCATAHRQIKKFEKTFAKLNELVGASDWHAVITLAGDFVGKFDEALEKALAADALNIKGGLPPSVVPKKKSVRRRELYTAMCKAYIGIEVPRKADSWCDEVLNMEGGNNNLDALKGKGEACLAQEQWEEATRYLELAFEASGRSSGDILARLQKAQRLLKQSKKKDYYKVLGVSRDADKRTVKRAYRKKAKTAHPDKGGSEATMAAVNQAYEVLSNPELRSRFDNGDDPNDPTSGQGTYAHPFAQGGHPFQFFQQSHGHGAREFKFAFGH
ncbi:TPR-like protein [Ramaria rubella]|nr:TPR-like protein [Ramaria rubella]